MNRPDCSENIVQRPFNNGTHRGERVLDSLLLFEYPLQLGNIGAKTGGPCTDGNNRYFRNRHI
ncbi:hypothetical protein D3C73_1412360 [compost metagenome]